MSAPTPLSAPESSSTAAAVPSTNTASAVPSTPQSMVHTLSPSGIVGVAPAPVAPSNTSTNTQSAPGAAVPTDVPAPAISPAVPTGPRAPAAGRATVRSGMGRNIRLGAPRTNPAIIEETASLCVMGSAIMHEGLPYRSLRNNNLHGPLHGGPQDASAATSSGTPVPAIPVAPAHPVAPPAPRLRADRNTRVDAKQKDVIISAGRIHRNQGRYVDKIVNNKQKYVLDTDWHLPNYDIVKQMDFLTPAERKAYWAKCHVEFTINVGSPTMAADVLAIVGHIDSLGPEFADNLGKYFVNLYIPDQQLRAANQKISAVASINALTPLVQKLATFKRTTFVVVTLRTVADRNTSCQYEWLDHAVPFCELPYEWNLDWWPNFMPGPTRYRVWDANYQYVNDQWRVLSRERTPVAAPAAAPAAGTGLVRAVLESERRSYAKAAEQAPKQK